jgi:hypothetical protein
VQIILRRVVFRSHFAIHSHFSLDAFGNVNGSRLSVSQSQKQSVTDDPQQSSREWNHSLHQQSVANSIPPQDIPYPKNLSSTRPHGFFSGGFGSQQFLPQPCMGRHSFRTSDTRVGVLSAGKSTSSSILAQSEASTPADHTYSGFGVLVPVNRVQPTKSYVSTFEPPSFSQMTPQLRSVSHSVPETRRSGRSPSNG